MPIDAVLFDFNGVLVDDEHLHLAAFNEVLEPLAVRMTDEAYAERYLGFDDRGAFNAVLRDHGLPSPEALVHDLIARKAEVYARRAVTELRIFPGAADVVRRVSEAVPIAIVSGALRAEIDGALKAMNVVERVRFIIAAEDVAACKPDPEGYHVAAKRLETANPSLRRSRMIAIEDSVAGIEAARAAGLGALAVAHSYPTEILTRSGARPVLAAIADVTLAELERAL